MAITPADHKVCKYLDEVCNLRGLGLQLGFPTGDLNQLETSRSEERISFCNGIGRVGTVTGLL